MRQRLSALVSLGSAFVFLASLYLTWQSSPAASCGKGCVVGAFAGDGWSSGSGDAAALVAVGTAVVAALALVRPAWSHRLPLARCGLALGYFALATMVGVWSRESLLNAAPGLSGRHLHWTYGVYAGVGAGAVAACAGAASSRGLPRRPTTSTLVPGLLGLGLLASFLLPWYRYSHGGHVVYWIPGISASAVVLAAVAVCFALTSTRRLELATAAALLTAAAFSESELRAYGAWLSLAFAPAFSGAAAVGARRSLRPALAGGRWNLLVAGAGAALVVSLFLPWQELCAASGRCVAVNGWGVPGSVAGILAAAVAAAALLRPRRRRTELVVAIALLVATAGLASQAPIDLAFAYGAYVTFAAAGVLLVSGLVAQRLPRLDRARPPLRDVPVMASLLLLAGVLLPWWSVLPSTWEEEAGVLSGWLAVGGALLALHLLASWMPWTGRRPAPPGTLTILPTAMLALVVLGVARVQPFLHLTWGGGIMIALCLLLIALGRFEERNGLESLRIPDLLRVDRLPETES